MSGKSRLELENARDRLAAANPTGADVWFVRKTLDLTCEETAEMLGRPMWVVRRWDESCADPIGEDAIKRLVHMVNAAINGVSDRRTAYSIAANDLPTAIAQLVEQFKANEKSVGRIRMTIGDVIVDISTGVAACSHPDDYRAPASGDGWVCGLCNADVVAPPEAT